jgi:penicillin amidase
MWEWQSVQSVYYEHPIASNPELARVFNLGPFLCKVGGGGSLNRRAARESPRGFVVAGGVSYRLFVNLAESDTAWGATLAGQSAQPGSPHYADRVSETTSGTHHPLMMDWNAIESAKEHETYIAQA